MAISDFIKKYFEPQEQIRLRDVVREIPSSAVQTGKNILGGLQKSGQSSLRGFAALGGAITGQTLTPSSYFQRELFGTTKPITLRSFGSELGLKQEGRAAPVVGFGLAAADLIPGGKITKSTAVGLLKNANKADDALKTLRQLMGVSDDVAKKYAPQLAQMTDTKQISSLVDNIVRESQDVSRITKSVVGKAKGLLTSADSIQKAKASGQSFDEWVKGQKAINPDNIEYHGTGKSFDRFMLGEEGSSGAGTEDYGVFTTKSKNAAKFWAEKSAGVGKDGNVMKVYLDIKNPKVFTSQEALDNFLGNNPAQAIETLKRQGFDAIRYPESGIDKFPFDYWDELASKGVQFKNKLPDEPYMTTQVFDPKNVHIIGKKGVAEIQNKLVNPLKEYPVLAESKVSDIQKINRLDDYSLTSKEWKLKVHIENYANKNDIKFNDAKQQIIDILKTRSQLKAEWDRVVVKPTTQQRGFISSAKEVLPDAQRISGQYVPRGTDELSIKAKNLIKTDFLTAERIALTESDDRAVAIASELLKKYADDAAKATNIGAKTAIYDKAAEVANVLAPKLTEQGRAIQAASILGRMTPEGQVRFAAREIQRFNETARIKIPELSGEQTKYILDEMKAINKMADGTERAMRFQKLQNMIQDLVPTPTMQKIITVWKAGLLTGIKTQGLNLFSNLLHGVSEVAKDIPASIVDSAASLFTGQRTKVFTTKKIGEGVSEGFEKGVRYFKTGFDERNIGTKLDYKRVNFGKGIVAKAFQAYTDTVFRALGASDQPFYYGALSRSLMDQALAQGKNLGLKGQKLVNFAYKTVESPSEPMIRYAVADATTAVFQNKTKLGDAARKIQNIPGVGEFVLPFGRTPSSVAMQIINYSPVGIAKTIIENIGRGKFDQRLFSQGIGRGLTGTAVLAIGVELFKKGMLSLDYPIGKEREQNLQKAEGTKNNAVLIDGKWRSPIVLGPLGNILLIGGHIQNALDQSGSPTEALSMAMFGGLKSFTEQTFLTGIQSAVNAITDPERYAKTYLPNLIASFVPTIVSDVARSTDPKERRTQGVSERIQARIPGLRQGLEPQVDILGREVERIGNPLEVLIDPTRPSPVKDTLVTGEIRRIVNAGFNVSPTMLGDRAGYDGLTPEQNTKLWVTTGTILNGKLTNLFNSPQYSQLSEDEKASTIEKFIKQSQISGRVAMALELTDGLSGEELKSKLSELKAGGLLNREVFDRYVEIR